MREAILSFLELTFFGEITSISGMTMRGDGGGEAAARGRLPPPKNSRPLDRPISKRYIKCTSE